MAYELSEAIKVVTIPPRLKSPSRSGPPAWQLGLIAAALIGLYFSIGRYLGLAVKNDDNFSHGWIVPLFSLFVLWENRKRLAELSFQPAWSGLWLLGKRPLYSRRRGNGGGALLVPSIVSIRVSWPDGSFLGLESRAGRSVPALFPTLDDSDSGDHLQPPHRAPANGSRDLRFGYFVIFGSAGFAGGKHPLPSQQAAQYRRSLQWNPLADVIGNA